MLLVLLNRLTNKRKNYLFFLKVYLLICLSLQMNICSAETSLQKGEKDSLLVCTQVSEAKAQSFRDELRMQGLGGMGRSAHDLLHHHTREGIAEEQLVGGFS